MSRLSPFPADANAPWRGVALVAQYVVQDAIRSVWFWLSLALLPLLMAGSVCVGLSSAMLDGDAGDDPATAADDAKADDTDVAEGAELAIVVADPALRARLSERGLLSDMPAPDSAAAVLYADGPDLSGSPKLVIRDAASAYVLEWQARGWWDAARESELPRAERRARRAERRDSVRDRGTGTIVAMVLGLVGALAWGAGTTAGGQLATTRDGDLAGVLRVGTPTSVIYVGLMSGRLLLTLIQWLPIVMLVGVPILLGGLLAAAVTDPWTLVNMPAALVFGACTAAAHYALGAAVALVADVLRRSDRTALSSAVSAVTVLANFAFFGVLLLVGTARTLHVAAQAALALLPFASPVVLGLHALDGPRGLALALVASLLNLVVAVVAIRLGGWAYSADEVSGRDVRTLLGRSA